MEDKGIRVESDSANKKKSEKECNIEHQKKNANKNFSKIMQTKHQIKECKIKATGA